MALATRVISMAEYRTLRNAQSRANQHDTYTRMREALRSITSGCRADMHEPDNNGVSATVSGDTLDNAMGDCDPSEACGEYIVSITDAGGTTYNFSLANLIALARVADTREFLVNGDY